MSTKDRESTNGNEGEGSRTAARNYAEGVARTVASGKVEELADKAEAALEGPEGAELKRAEAAAKSKKDAPVSKSPN